MSSDLPKFKAPPVVEVVLSLQFESLPKLSAAHIGWYWQEKLGAEWSKVDAAPKLKDAFGERTEWERSALRIEAARPQNIRLQFTQDGDERMIQVQDTRFIYNWRKRAEGYPSFDALLPEFEKRFEDFSAFVRESQVGDITLNQWELTYVDHIEKGTLWDSPSDWKDVSPFLGSISVDGQTLETIRAEASFILGDYKGRLTVNSNHVRIGGPDGPEAIGLNFTVRGPVEGDYRTGLRFGHEHALRSFVSFTSERAHAFWKRSR